MTEDISKRGWDPILSSLQASLLAASLLLTLFEMFRRLRGGKNPVYGGNHFHQQRSELLYEVPEMRELPERPTYLFGWLVSVLRVDGGQELLDLVGLDGYVLLRFLKMQSRITLFAATLGLTVLVPIYKSGENAEDDPFYQTTLANLVKGSDRHWWTLAMAYLFCAHALYQIDNEYAGFVGLRHQFFVSGSTDTSPQARYSVMVECVPPHLRTSKALQAYFDFLFPGKVHSASVCIETRLLRTAWQNRERVAQLLERSLLAQARSPDDKCSVRPWASGVDRTVRALTGQEHFLEAWQRRLCRCPSKQDAVPYLTQVLEGMNEWVAARQEVVRTNSAEAEAATEQSMPAMLSAFIFGVEETIEGFVAPRGSLACAAESEMVLNAQRSGKAVRRTPMIHLPGATVGHGRERSDSLWNMLFGSLRGGPRDPSLSAMLMEEVHLPPGGSGTYGTSDELGAAARGDASTSPLTVVMEEEGAAPAVQRESRGLLGNLWYHLGGVRTVAIESTSAVARTGARQAMDTAHFVADGTLGSVARALATLEALTIGKGVSGTGFVTFTSLAAREVSHQVLLSNAKHAGRMSAMPAPEPRDVIWMNVHKPLPVVRQRRALADVMFGLGSLLFNVPLAALAAAANQETLERTFPAIKAYQGETWYITLMAYLPSLLSLGLVQLTPLVFQLVARYYECYKSEVEVQKIVLQRFFVVQLVFVYVSVLGASVVDAIFAIIGQPAAIFTILGTSLPGTASYFMTLMVVKTFQALAFELSRLWSLFLYALRSTGNARALGERDILHRDRPDWFSYAVTYPAFLMSAVVGYCFECICPLVQLFCCLYFVLGYVVYKHQLIYAYAKTSESGGEYFFIAFNRTLTAMVAGQITLTGYLSLREAFVQASLAFLLIPMTLYWGFYLNAKYERPASSLSLEKANYVDARVGGVSRSRFPSHNVGSMQDEAKEAGAAGGKPAAPALASQPSSASSTYEDVRGHFQRATYLQPEMRFMGPVEPLRSRWLRGGSSGGAPGAADGDAADGDAEVQV